MSPSIAITGIGLISPAGSTPAALWAALVGRAELRGPWPKRSLAAYPVDNCVAIPEAQWRALDVARGGVENRAAALARFAVERCLEAAGLAHGGPAEPAAGAAPAGMRIGCVLGTTTAGVEVAENALLGRHGGEAAGVAEFDASRLLPGDAARWQGPLAVLSTACSSGLLAPSLAIDALLAGEADAMVAGGVDVLLEYTVCGFNGLRVATRDACRPFDASRQGVVLSEGAACVCLERLDAALARRATIHAVVSARAAGCDAAHATAPDIEGVARTLIAALTAPAAHGGRAARPAGVFAHGTGTPTNDIAEITALRAAFAAAFGSDALPPVTSIKATLGHPQAAAGAFSLAAACLALRHRSLPPTANLQARDAALGDAPIVDGAGWPLEGASVLVDAFGFGGNNCVMVLTDPAALHELEEGAA
ncbi:beta-ketoacyl synthase [Burkholderia glumae]|uniref:beta-ketoacyl synthase N-terminal-like domain-containing protein n=1 Tax=Burkholderia glumae TaxID=337 RepID=UPI000F5FFC78|nr:beta-ketoacyl synthase N-terminal-like domain-containing protein [Burkholderia glumae]MCQ0029785.1 beta-ketoacyl synthase [Burkholderia glumae]QJW77677.1 beta-ketoacyl synthase [Burkholderia glumae]RQZ73508.1 beta-ketoacyl synthase [Burkholderia glumae]UVS87154.1 beta-ketoacyl synthase [Burkholderia glumae]